MAVDVRGQAVQAGFKMTEVGEIPEDWNIVKVKDVTSFHKQGYYTTENYLPNGKYYLLRGTDMQNPVIDLSTTPKINANLSDYEAYKVLTNDFLIVRSGAIGRYGIAKINLPKSIFGSYLINFRFNEDVLPYYFGYFYASSLAINQILSITQGGGNLNINAANIKSLSFVYPKSLTEQRAIASVLSDADALITYLEKLIDKKKSIKQGAMQELLTGKTRLKGFGKGVGMKMTEVGEIPEDWEVKGFFELGEPIQGLTYSPADVHENGVLVLRSSNILNNKLVFKDNVYVQAQMPSRVIVQEHDILICVRNGSKQLIGKCAIIDKNAAGMAFGAFMTIFRTPHSGYVFYQLQSDIIQKKIDESLGATINQLTKKDIGSFKIAVPLKKSEEMLIVKTLSDMDSEISMLEKDLEKQRKLKQGMMQQLLTGKIRLI